jgi:ABC-type glycerol-3-phosphate transport system substrate-binding protein
MKNLTFFIFFLVFLLMTALVFATGGAQQQTSLQGAPKNIKSDLLVAVAADIEPTQWFKDSIVKFNELYPNINVIVETHEGVPARPKFVSAVYANNAPDVLYANLYWVKDFALNGWLTPVSDYFNKEEMADFYKSFVDYATVEGKVYGFFTETSVATIIYRKSMLKEAGVTVPTLDQAWTWDQFFQAAQKVTKDTNGDGKTDIWGGGVIGYRGGATTYTNFPLFFMLGGKLIDDKGYPAFNTSAAHGAYQFYHDLIYKYKVAPPESYSYSNDELLPAFNAGQYSMFLGASYMIENLNKQFPNDVGAMLYPVPKAGDPSQGLSGGWVYTIMTQDDKLKSVSADFIREMVSRENNIKRYQATGAFPVRISAAAEITKQLQQPQKDWMTVFSKQMEHTNQKPGDAIYDIIQDEYTMGLQNVMMDKMTARQAAQTAYDNTITRAKEAKILK